MTRFWLTLCVCLFAAHSAAAETRSISYTTWNVTGGDIRVQYVLPDKETKNVAMAGSPQPTTKQAADYILAHLAVLRQGKPCAVVDQGQDLGLISTLALSPGSLRFEVVFSCQDGAGLTLSDTTFADRVTNHIVYARVHMDDGGFVEHAFTAGAPRMTLPNTPAALRSDSFLRYTVFGLSHVYRSVDILCFMLALVLVARQRRDYVFAFGALAGGYAVAVLLSAFALAAPRFDGGLIKGLFVLVTAVAAVIFALPDSRRGLWVLGGGALALAVPAFLLHGTAAALAVLGVAMMTAATLFVPARDDRRAVFLLATPFVFALLDGFVLAGDLSPLALPAGRLAPMLAGFNAGALVAAAALPLLLAAVWFLVPWARRRVQQGRFIPDLATAVCTGCGIFWFATRLYA